MLKNIQLPNFLSEIPCGIYMYIGKIFGYVIYQAKLPLIEEMESQSKFDQKIVKLQ